MNPPTGSPRSARSTTVSETAQDAVRRLGPWFHNVTLPDGTQTCSAHPLGLGDFPRWKWDQIKDHLPGDLGGARALDIGCNAGFYALELARRGAHVVAIDHDERYLRQATWVVEQ